jgi:hypothetical protein
LLGGGNLGKDSRGPRVRVTGAIPHGGERSARQLPIRATVAHIANKINLGHVPITQNVLDADFEEMASIGSNPELWYTSLLGHTGIAIAI